MLNFGHSFGHALETLYKYKINHGEAISVGMIIESKLSNTLGFLSDNDLIKQLIIFQMWTKKKDNKINNKLIFENLSKDKKLNNKLILLVKKIGNLFKEVCKENQKYS